MLEAWWAYGKAKYKLLWAWPTAKLFLCRTEPSPKPSGSGEKITWDIGTYTVGQNYIHFTIKDHEPKKYMGQSMHWVKSETIFFQFMGLRYHIL